ncbi:hypothetical protein, partial [Rickettsia sp. R1]
LLLLFYKSFPVIAQYLIYTSLNLTVPMKAVKNAKEAKEEVRGATKPLTAKSTTKKLLESKLQPKKTKSKSKTKQRG